MGASSLISRSGLERRPEPFAMALRPSLPSARFALQSEVGCHAGGPSSICTSLDWTSRTSATYVGERAIQSAVDGIDADLSGCGSWSSPAAA
jgi:hypothetical protein